MPLSRVKPEQYEDLLADKVARVTDMMRRFDAPSPEVYRSPATGFRMRAEFRMWHDGDELDYVMFRREDRKTPIPVTDFPIACETIQRLMPALLSALKANTLLRQKLFQVEFLSTLAGESLITLVYHRKLDEEWQTAAQQLRENLQQLCGELSVIGRSRKQKLVVGKEWVWEALDINGETYRYQQYEQAFTQPNASVNTRMIGWACQQAANLDGDLLELYCGNGNFTLPLSRHFRQVIATELSKTSIRAARENILANGVDNISMIRLSAEEVTQAMNGEREFRRLAELPKALQDFDLQTLFVDPPRAGLDEATAGMAVRFPAIIYISCNPHTLAGNLDQLCLTHDIENFALFDQFPYTDHMECGVLLRKKATEANTADHFN